MASYLCRMSSLLRVEIKFVMLSVFMLSVVILNVAAPFPHDSSVADFFKQIFHFFTKKTLNVVMILN
jgi:hypothetical protein